ncbi:MAG: hypothetical protein EAZ44_06300 [Cytophagia bacterium]|nr:MAG: hypothetical protein EAY69_09400 [Cytophagales bacterium]TAG03124.1 MAG: hypothetical protein EAZ44_06300 [Cytophagia bacterium]TAG39598.1 MAG: hypothetical protein EAZ31_09015 [Cytophagia bacterium]TAH28832.1 MAG: hypothetical protein EAZ06_08780 [Cytophagales bacterium]
MLEYVKMILEKVSFDLVVFEKELRKSIHSYLPSADEIESLRQWCYNKFDSSEHLRIMKVCFSA